MKCCLYFHTCFPCLSEMYKTVYDLTRIVSSFCEKYNLDPKRCAEGLFCFAQAYSKFHSSNWYAVDDQNYDDDDIKQDHNERDVDENYAESIELRDGLKEQHDGHLSTTKNDIHGSFSLGHLKDAFPELCKVYGIISAILISSCTAEHSFFVL